MTAALLALALVLAAPAADPWPHTRGGPHQLGVAKGTVPDAPVLRWTFAAGDEIRSSAVIGRQGRVYFGASDGHLRALALETGKPVWDVDVKVPIEAPPTLVGDVVIVGDMDGAVHARARADGAARWTYATGDRVAGAANWHVRADGGTTVLVGSYDRHVHAIDLATGKRLWTYETEDYVHTSPAVGGGTVFVGGCDGHVHLASAADGAARGKIPIGGQTGSSVAVDPKSGRAWLGHYRNQFLCLDTAGKSTRWVYEDRSKPYFSSAAVSGDTVVFGGRDKRLHAADAATGKAKWTYRAKGKVDGSPVIAGGRVVAASEDGRLHVVDLATGAPKWTWDLGAELTTTPAVGRGWIVLGASDGKLRAFGPKD